MKRLFTLVGFVMIFSLSALQAQTLLYSENFENNSLPDSVVFTGTGVSGKSSTLFSQGSRSDSMRIAVPGDTVVMTTPAFSTIGSSNVMLYFDHICKIEYLDEGFLEVSNDNGVTWTRLTATQYLGSAPLLTQGNKFASYSYQTWRPNVDSFPSNAWWKNEIFDISLLVGNAANVKVRFVLRDVNMGTGPGSYNYGWWIDNIRILGAISELTPPAITINPPVLSDTVYSAGPFAINATITDASGIDTAMIVYTVNAGTPDTIGMVNTSGNLFTGTIPVQSFNSNICYKIVAIDGSVSHNTGYAPSAGCTNFYTKQAMMGTYTIGGTGADYATFAAAVTALNTAGVSGPVEFVVAPGTYTGQITLISVTGMDQVNTVTFRSANNDSTSVTLQYAASSTTDNWVVRFDGARHFIFRAITLKATGASNGRVVEYINKPSYIQILNCRLETNLTATGSAFAPVYSTSSLGPEHITISNSVLRGGYYGIYWYGSSANRKNHLVLTNNIIEETYIYGIYTYYADSLFFSGNTFRNRAGAATYYGMYFYYMNGYSEITRNKVISQNTGTNYGIAILSKASTSPVAALIANNYITYAGTGTTNTIYAIYLSSSYYVNIYHNSVSVYGGSATGGRGIYQTSGGNIDIKNNIFANFGGGYAYYINTPTAITGSDYNCYYSTGPNLAYWTSAHTSLASLRTANGTDTNSVNLNPPFTSNTDLSLTTTTLSGKGTYLPSVPIDITGYPRSPVPTIGAYEIPLLPKDAGVVSFVTPTSQSYIGESDLVPVTVTIVNMGTDSLISVDVHYRVNGGTPFTVTYNGLLYQFQTASLVMPAYVSPAGQVQLKAWTTLPGDTNFFNDTAYFSYYGVPLFDARMKRIIPLASPCGLGMETVKVVIENVGSSTMPANFSVSYRLDNTSTVVTHTVPDSIPVNDSLIYSFPTPVNLTATVDTTFKLFAWVTLAGDNVQTNDTTNLDIESKPLPAPPTVTTPVNIPYGATATLNASSTLPIYWFASDTSTVKLDTGYTFVTPYLFDTTTFWAQAGTAMGSPSSLATGTQTSNYAAAQTRGFHFTAPVDMIITELMVPNTVTSGTQYIQVVKFTGYPVAYPSGSPFTTIASITNAPFNVPQPVNIAIQAGDEIGIIGGSNSTGTTMNMSYGSAQQPSSINGIPVVLTRLVYQSPLVSGLAPSGSIGLEVTSSIGRIDVKYVVGGTGCPSIRVPVVVNTALPPPVDAGIAAIVNPYNSAPSNVPHPIQVSLKNYGLDTLTSAGIVWSLNNVVQDTIAWTGSLPYSNTQLITIDTMIFQGGVYCLKSWTIQPNNTTDTVPLNDTANHCFSACLSGTYTIGPATTGTWNYNTFAQAVTALQTVGICGPVIFEVQPGTYTGQITLPDIPAMNHINTVTFRGATADSSAVIVQYAATATTDNWVLRFNGSRYFTFQHLTIKATGASYGYAVEFINGPKYNRILNCVLETSITTTSSSFAPVYSTSSAGPQNITISNSRLIGGYYGVYWNGSTSARKNNLVFTNNQITEPYYYGMYTYYADSLFLTGNSITSRTTSGVFYGIYCYYINGFSSITKNNVNGRNTSTYAGIALLSKEATSTVPALVANNFVTYTGTGTTNTIYALYLSSSNYVNLYHNSVRVQGGSPSTGYAMYQTSGAGNDIRNNIFANYGGGLAYYVGTPTAVTQSNYNNYFTTGTSLAYWNGNTYASLSALQTGNAKDAQSQNINPPFTSNTDLHLVNSALSGMAQPLGVITDDIDGNPRTTAPTIGAHEVPLLPVDAGVTAILSPPPITFETQTYPVQVTVRNWGTTAIENGFTVQYTVNGGNPVSMSFSDTIAPQTSVNFTLPSMVSPAGNSTICARTILTGDGYASNDQFCKNFFGNPQYDALAAKAKGPEGGCGLGMDTIRLQIKNVGGIAINTPTPSVITASYQVLGSGTIVTENVTQPIPVGDSLWFTFATLNNFAVTADSTFKVFAWVKLTGDNVAYNDTANFEVVSLRTPPPPVVTNVTIPYGTSTTLTAQSQDSIFWYASDTASVELAKGTSYTTPLLYTNTTYWVGATSGGLGAGANIALLAAADHIGGGQISTGYGPNNYNDGIIPPYNCTPTPCGWGWTNTNGWIEYTWTTPQTFNAVKFYKDNRPMSTCVFQYWDGTAYVNFYNYSSTVLEDSVSFPPVTSTKLRFNSIAGSSNPNFREIQVFEPKQTGCSSTRAPLVVTVSNQAPCDVGILSLVQPTSAINLGSQENVRIRVKNFGTQAQSNIPVSFRIDNMPVVTETMVGAVGPNDTVDYIFTTKANLSVAGTTYNFKAWTGLACDNTHQNDTVWKSVTNLLPTYCASNATSALNQEVTNVTLGTLNHTSVANGAMYTNHTTTAIPPMLSPGVTYPMSITSSFAPGSTTSQNCWVKAWIDFNRDGVFDATSEMVFSSATFSSNTVTANVQIPFTASIGNTVMRVVLNQTTSATSVNPCGTYTYGETEDYMVTIAPQAPCDAGVIQIISPVSLTQSGTPLPVWVMFMNFGSDPIAAGALSVAYKLNNGTPVVANYPLGMLPGAVDSIQMPSVTLPMGNNTLCAYTILACDTTLFNNEMCKGVYGQYVSSIPFFDDFEASNNWYKPPASANWQYGTPAGNVINAAYSGSKAWVTNLTGNYTDNANEYLNSPVFDFSGLGGTDTITLSFYHWLNLQSGDYGRVQYSIDGGVNWANLGFSGDPLGTNWYNTQVGGVHYFSLTNTGWMYSAYKLDPNTFNIYTDVRFRFNFVSNTSGNSNGWAIDNFRLSLPLVPNDVGISMINYPVLDTAMGSVVYPTVKLNNYGTNTQTMIPIVLKVNGNIMATEIWTGALAPQSSTSYSFIQSFTVPSSAYSLCIETQLVGDPHPSNDGTCKNFTPQPAYHDVGAILIVAPLPDSIGEICLYEATTHSWYQYTVKVRLQNFGQNAQTSIPLKYTFFNGGPLQIETWTGNLAPGTTVDVDLANKFLPNMGAQQVCVETILVGDLVPTNNKACQSYIGRLCIGVDEMESNGFTVGQNVPNPASGNTLIPFMTPEGGEVQIVVTDLPGQIIHREILVKPAGEHTIELDVNHLSQGVYYYTLEYKGQRITRKMVVRK